MTETTPTVVLREVSRASGDFSKLWQLRAEVLLDPFGISHERAKSDDGMARHFGLFAETDCVACLFLVPREEGRIQMRQIAVAGEHQGRGYGRLLLHHAEGVGLQSGFRTMFAAARVSALGFYEAVGYRVVGEEFEQVGMPHFSVEKDLS